MSGFMGAGGAAAAFVLTLALIIGSFVLLLNIVD